MTANAGDPVIYDRCSLLFLSTSRYERYPRWILRIIATGSRSRILGARAHPIREITSCSRIAECALACVRACLFKVKGGRGGGEGDADKVIYIPR